MEMAFLPRHGTEHEYSPHTVPYRANMWTLRSLGVRQFSRRVPSTTLTADLGPGAVVVPDQLVDRTRSRKDTYFDGGGIHVGFADPYCPTLRAVAVEQPGVDGGTMVVIQGPAVLHPGRESVVRDAGLHAGEHDRLSRGRPGPRA